MTVEALIIAFGVPAVGLLTGIFFRMGAFTEASKNLKEQFALLRADFDELRKEYAK